ncbi:SGNH/GDSL hydrolase family protein [Noviherbaspirillum sp.]|jgi:hypothetical protein|uniref:SGNH/GDSL hydrolase family protein n=1 Tax=Noviherbaspirillum sp. TaxID=1926288 RepID=UPI0025D6BE91|nr:SGNH/GDSL hydrolase family protein [Noviherbaspirillum sp.]
MKLSALVAAIPFLLAACGGGGSDANTSGNTQSLQSAIVAQPAAATAAATTPSTAATASAAQDAPATTPSASAPQPSAESAPTQAQAPAQSAPTQVSAPVQEPAATTSPSSTTTTAPANNTPVLVEYYGDSIIWGWLPNNDWVRVESPAPAVFAADTGLTVHNMGSPGRLAEAALAGDGVYPAWNQQMAQSKATHVIIEYHSHDTVANTTSRVRQLIQIAKANGKKVIVETIGPGYHSGDLSFEQITQAQRDAAAAENVPVIDQTAYLQQYLASSGKGVWDICPDGLHPDQTTYILKGHYAAKQFAAMK